MRLVQLINNIKVSSKKYLLKIVSCIFKILFKSILHNKCLCLESCMLTVCRSSYQCFCSSCTRLRSTKHIIRWWEMYTVSHKKPCHFVFDNNSCISCSIFILFVPVETKRNTAQFTYLMTWSRHNCITSHITKVCFIQLLNQVNTSS